MTRRSPTMCRACLRFRIGFTCKAFPNGIPDEIGVYGADHRKPLEGDGGVVFAQKDTDEAREAFGHWQSVFG